MGLEMVTVVPIGDIALGIAVGKGVAVGRIGVGGWMFY
jgi:hypothetical protein